MGSWQDFLSVNKKGNVPTLVLEDGSVLNENVAVLTWLSQQGAPDASLGYPAGSPGYYRMLNATAFIASELHSTLGVLFFPTPSDEARCTIVATPRSSMAHAARMLDGRRSRRSSRSARRAS